MSDQLPRKVARVGLELGRLERTTTPEGVYVMLRRAILDGTFRSGSQLRERDIAADLGVSRSPLREALTRLEEEGLILKVPFRGAFVAEVSAQEVAEIASIRLLLEPYAADLAREALKGPARDRLTQAVDELRLATEMDDIPASIDAHLQFHGLFYELSGHGVLGTLWKGWETKLRLYFTADHASYADVQDIALEHERLATVALGGDTDAFRQELARHFKVALGAYGEGWSGDAQYAGAVLGDSVLLEVPSPSALAEARRTGKDTAGPSRPTGDHIRQPTREQT